MKKIIFFLILGTQFIYSQEKQTIDGRVVSNGQPVPYANVLIKNTTIGTTTNEKGTYTLKSEPGKVTVVVQNIGYETLEKIITVKESGKNVLDFDIKEITFGLNQVVVTGTKTFKRQTETPVIVNIMDGKTLNNLQVCNLSEGLKFQPGLRVETDCQTCNYTQLRMNGLQGGYSQILINGRPIFSPLMGLYGMEQLPVNMIEKIEVVRGGGSSLYGSSAIGGTVNVITKLPKKNGYEINTFYQNIDDQTNDFNFNANATLVNEAENAGITFFMNKRDRGFYDANGDNFSEIPKAENTAFGLNSYFKFTENQKLEISLSNLNEYRFGGEMVEKPAYQTQQSEERTHKIWMGSADYQINFNEDKSSFIVYSAFQKTKRNHYTGLFPDDVTEIPDFLANPPYGVSDNTTIQGGFQYNHEFSDFFNTKNVFTVGSEYISDKVFDNIPSYNFLVDQHTKNLGAFLQSDWDFAKNFNLLSGIRMDQHNFLNRLIFSPRVALLYKLKTNTQFRVSYGTGFRAPQAFDTDLHIAFAGGGVSRVQLAENLKEERSESFSASVNYDKTSEKWVAGFTLEGFYTKLKDVFVNENIGQDEFGEIFRKSNGQGSAVSGITLELRANFNRKVQLETGFTVQNSRYDSTVINIEGLAPSRNYLRTPNDYGFANLTFTPNKNWNINLNYVYTGTMEVAHFKGAENFNTNDVIVNTKSFSELNSKVAYNFHVHKFETNFEIYGGIKNMANTYQNDFDKGKNRDSNYIYGPSMPITYFIGLKIFPN